MLARYFEKKPWFLDYVRTTEDYKTFVFRHFVCDFVFQHRLRYMIYFRNSQNSTGIIKKIYQYKMYRLCRKYGIEINTRTQIGEGFLMIHPYNITINPSAILGRNVNMLKGSTIAKSEGKRPGVPIIGDDVYIGLNAVVLGGITVGDDVLIAPNTVVNQDIPSHSLVMGNPCRVISREGATNDYLSFKV